MLLLLLLLLGSLLLLGLLRMGLLIRGGSRLVGVGICGTGLHGGVMLCMVLILGAGMMLLLQMWGQRVGGIVHHRPRREWIMRMRMHGRMNAWREVERIVRSTLLMRVRLVSREGRHRARSGCRDRSLMALTMPLPLPLLLLLLLLLLSYGLLQLCVQRVLRVRHRRQLDLLRGWCAVEMLLVLNQALDLLEVAVR